MKLTNIRVTLWSVAENEFSLLEEKTHQSAREWIHVSNLLDKIWIGSLDKKYWGAITKSMIDNPIDYTKRINIGREVTGRAPIFDQEFFIIEHIEERNLHGP
ncbi:hypothetical protein CpMRi49_01510 [Corynebacterium ulcerans]|uniref:hypothetical protein n=1 Tax=Corynebacterium ulcerans TaxID=65058 RepID=UPI001303674A|nr:hypothetical protein [Corynebacterium ulcerans]MBL4943500.1 hypothetical protein [Corynebacterium ulcerans]QGZ24706.1 hypothetical protein CpMRi49_01510 [Corynebacterium ulcerans]QOE23419.1 hypothetical protein HUF05_01815 [Corynebacterium ulcerans]